MADRLWWLHPIGQCYQRGYDLLRSCTTFSKAPLPTIGIGSLLVGGAGKTPLVSWLCRQLQYTYLLAVVSRGYGRTSKGLQLVNQGAKILLTAEESGDELQMLAHQHPQVVMIASESRLDGCLEAHRRNAQLVLIDDAFQHLGLLCDRHIVVLPAESLLRPTRGFPAGPFREPLKALHRADRVVLIGKEEECQDARSHLLQVAPHKILEGEVRIGTPWSSTGHLLSPGDSVAVFAGIARPYRLLRAVQEWPLQVVSHWFLGDHERPSPTRFFQWTQEAQRQGARCLITSEKDGARSLPTSALPVVYLPIELHFRMGAESLIGMIEKVLHAAPGNVDPHV